MARTVTVLVCALMVGAYVPMALGQAGYLQQDSTMTTSNGTKVNLHQAYTFQDRRDLQRALEIYREYIRQGQKDLIRPSINDRDSIDIYLLNPLAPDRDMSEVIGTPSAPEGYVHQVKESISEQELTAEQRAVLQRAVKVGRCWNFTEYSAEFYNLCKRLIKGREMVRTIGIQSDLAKMSAQRAGAASSVTNAYAKDRLQYRRVRQSTSFSSLSGYKK